MCKNTPLNSFAIVETDENEMTHCHVAKNFRSTGQDGISSIFNKTCLNVLTH